MENLQSNFRDILDSELERDSSHDTASKEIEKAFNQSISEKLVLFDPIDRCIPKDNDQATKFGELRQIIHQMPFLSGKQLNAPLTNQMIA